MKIDVELLIKFLSIVIAGITVGKGMLELLQGTRRSMEHDYKFAKEFLTDVASSTDLHPYLREKGYQAIAGSKSISAAEVQFLLSMASPVQALRDYSLGRGYLKHFSTAGSTQIAFKKKYRQRWVRAMLQIGYFAIYMTGFVTAFSPLVLSTGGVFIAADPWLATFLGCLSLLPISFLSLREGVRIARAAALVANQSKQAGSSTTLCY